MASAPASKETLKVYHSSPKLSRYFCDCCGSHMFIEHHEPPEWLVCTGAVDRVVKDDTDGKVTTIETLKQHEFIESTIDGGLALCLSEIDGRKIPIFAQGPDGEIVTPLSSAPVRLETSSLSGHRSMDANQRLHAACHCRSVIFEVTRPSAKSEQLSSPWPDLLVPYHSSSSENTQDVKWWLRAENSKYLAGTCACRSCRLASGFPIQAWGFIPKVNIRQPNGLDIDFKSSSLGSFESSPGVYRHFCKVCGATAFWRCEERPDLIDVSVGLLQAPEGSRASTWLEWHTDRVSFCEEALDMKLIHALGVGLKHLQT